MKPRSDLPSELKCTRFKKKVALRSGAHIVLLNGARFRDDVYAVAGDVGLTSRYLGWPVHFAGAGVIAC
jgi:hypothetical protein